jgi:hypothetical protein
VKVISREIRDLPKSVLREHLRVRKGKIMNADNFSWKSLNPREILLGLLIFIVPTLGDLVELTLGYGIGSWVGKATLLTTLILILSFLIIGLIKGFPRWTVPALGIVVIGIVEIQAVPPIWSWFAKNVIISIKPYTTHLADRIQYSALSIGFFSLLSFISLVLIILLLMTWTHTRSLAKQIRKDWTLLSFIVFSSTVFRLEVMFDEYANDEVWKIACYGCLAIGAWIYYKTSDQRKRILALIVGVSLTYLIAAIGKWNILPLQSWGSRYGYDHWFYYRFVLVSILAGWLWSLFFILFPAIVRLIPGRHRMVDLAQTQTREEMS